MKDPIFILGNHKSGTSLLRNLLDGHPELFAVPNEINFFNHAGYWVDYGLLRARPEHLDYEGIYKRCLKVIEDYNSKSHPMTDANLVGMFDLERLRQEFSPPFSSHRDLLEALYKGIYNSLFGRRLPGDLRVVEKSVGNAEFALDLINFFPNSKFIHIIRNPYSNLVSLRRYLVRGRRSYPQLLRPLQALYNSYYHLYKNQNLLPQMLVIRYEDLISAGENTMRQVADFIEIDWSPTLLQPTSLGKPWSGNSSSGKKFSEISSAQISSWRTEITHLEIHLINRLFPFVLRDFSYEQISPRRSLYWPVRGEAPKTFLLNRAIVPFLGSREIAS